MDYFPAEETLVRTPVWIGTLAAVALSFATLGAQPAVAAAVHRPIAVVGASQSNNWSGYNQGTLEKDNAQFHSITGQWVVPTATLAPHRSHGHSSTWVGIGGGCVNADCSVTDSTLIQAGTEQDAGPNGARYNAWWEIIPAPSTKIAHFPVHPGDTISVSIAETSANSESWAITVTNVTTGKVFTTTTPYPSTYATAEWIEETPVVISNGGHVKIGPMPRLTEVNITNATTNGQPADLVPSEAIDLVGSGGHVLARPSAPGADGASFNVCVHERPCTAP
jgi:hypothetical protein